MSKYDDNMRGVLFPVEEKKTEKHPDYTGSFEIDGQEYRLAGWKRESRAGKIYLSLSISVKEREKKAPVNPVKRNSIYDDEIPF